MRFPLLIIALAATTIIAQAQIAAVSNRLGYTGEITRYDSLAEAQTGTNPTASASLGSANRDLRLYLTKGFDVFALPDAAEIATAWHFSTASSSPGDGNPNNVLSGFVQMPNSPTTASAKAFWDASLTTFNLSIHGSNTDLASNPRLWNGTGTAAQLGEFLEYDFSLTASGLEPAFWVPIANTYASYSEPTAVSGHFRGLFHNTTDDIAANGFYTFDFGLNLDSWVYANRDNLVQLNDPFAEDSFFEASVFAAPTAVPEPATYGLIAVSALLALSLHRRFRTIRG